MSATFDPKRVAVIELPKVRSGHLLIRGNMPLVGTGFAYPEIENSLNLDFSADRFVDVSFIDNTGERDSWSAEVGAFGVDPATFPASDWPPYVHRKGWNPGTFLGSGELVYSKDYTREKAHVVWWPFEGMAPNDDPKVFLHSPGWDFAGCVEYLFGLYTDVSTPPTIFYVHCMLGADRTGALHAGLLVRAGMGIDEALAKVAAATPAGAPNADYIRLAKAYAADRGRS